MHSVDCVWEYNFFAPIETVTIGILSVSLGLLVSTELDTLWIIFGAAAISLAGSLWGSPHQF
jgi:hypothetical protein